MCECEWAEQVFLKSFKPLRSQVGFASAKRYVTQSHSCLPRPSFVYPHGGRGCVVYGNRAGRGFESFTAVFTFYHNQQLKQEREAKQRHDTTLIHVPLGFVEPDKDRKWRHLSVGSASASLSLIGHSKALTVCDAISPETPWPTSNPKHSSSHGVLGLSCGVVEH